VVKQFGDGFSFPVSFRPVLPQGGFLALGRGAVWEVKQRLNVEGIQRPSGKPQFHVCGFSTRLPQMKNGFDAQRLWIGCHRI
jgi:hypothetical protein